MLATLFNILFISIPLVFYKNTSELFEFNKIVLLYICTTLIVAVWIYRSILAKKIIFRRTILDIPLLLYLSIYLLSTLLSIDPRSSWLGYYSRFNGGFVSQLCYALLYWAFVSFISRESAHRIVKNLLTGVAIVATIGFFEHFGIFSTCPIITHQRLQMPQNTAVASQYGQYSIPEKINFLFTTKCWEQDLQNRVFSTIGQPNWLAAILVALIPLTWFFSFKTYGIRRMAYYTLSVLFFAVLLFTKSRSGILAFGVGSILFWGLILHKFKKIYLKEFVLSLLVFGLLSLSLFYKSKTNVQQLMGAGPSLEQGGTESGSIRKIVWKGAFSIFKHYPILGTGPETFAYAYPMFKPLEHNLTSEWDFIYNKAHNEYLNYLANTGVLGFLSYMTLISFSIIQIVRTSKFKTQSAKQTANLKLVNINSLETENWQLKIGLLSGYIAILVTNFFGFSVVLTSLLFFIFPALAFAIKNDSPNLLPTRKITMKECIFSLLILLTGFYLLVTIYRYWQADIHYNNSRLAANEGDYNKALNQIDRAIRLSPKETAFLADRAVIRTHLAEEFLQAEEAFSDLRAASALSPYNLNYKRTHAVLLSQLSQYNSAYLPSAVEIINEAIKIAPTDAKLHYQLGLLYLKTGQTDRGISALQKSVELKPNYKDGRFALAVTYKESKQVQKAVDEFKYILEHIDSRDELTKKYLNEINQAQK